MVSTGSSEFEGSTRDRNYVRGYGSGVASKASPRSNRAVSGEELLAAPERSHRLKGALFGTFCQPYEPITRLANPIAVSLFPIQFHFGFWSGDR
jgi:hypothetical protein